MLNSDAGSRDLIFDVAAFTILVSIAAHGLTDTLGARWVRKRMGVARRRRVGRWRTAGLD